MMNEQTRLTARIRRIQSYVLAGLLATLVVWAAVPGLRHVTAGLLLGEVGGAYVVYSMIRGGHRNDAVQGAALFLSGMLGMVTRFLVLAVVLIVAVHYHISAVAALIGYVSGFAVVFAGFVSFVRNA